jgi:hypothetical protein
MREFAKKIRGPLGLHEGRIDQRDVIAQRVPEMFLEHGIMRTAENERIEIEWKVRANLGDRGPRHLALGIARFDERNERRRWNFDDIDAGDARSERTAVRTRANGRRRRDDADPPKLVALYR